MNVTRLHWWLINIGSCNGLVPLGNKSLLLIASVDPNLGHHMASLGHNELTLFVQNLFWETYYILLYYQVAFHIMFQLWDVPDNGNSYLWKTTACLSCIVNIMAADVLETPGAGHQQPLYMYWPCFSRNIPLWAPQGTLKDMYGNWHNQNLQKSRTGVICGRTGSLLSPHGLFTCCLLPLNLYGACKLMMHVLKLNGQNSYDAVRASWVDVRFLFKTAREQPVWGPGGCFTDVSWALQNNLVKIYNVRNNIYAENFKLKLCTCAQSIALGKRTKFSLKLS